MEKPVKVFVPRCGRGWSVGSLAPTGKIVLAEPKRGTFHSVQSKSLVQRNDLCPCGSKKKAKNCCL